MSLVVVNRNFANLESAAAALASLTTALLASRKGHPSNIFGHAEPGGENCKLAYSIRKFTGSGWEGVVEGNLLFNFSDRGQMAAAQTAIEAQISEILPQTNIEPGYVLRIGFVA